MKPEAIIAIGALLLSAVSLSIGVQNHRRTQAIAEVLNGNTEVILDELETQEARVGQVETFVYSGGAIDQRKNGGVW